MKSNVSNAQTPSPVPASTLWTFESSAPKYTAPSTTAGDDVIAPPAS